MAAAALQRAHRKLALTLIVVATLLAFLANFALWANRQLLDTGNWTDTSTKLLEDDAIREQVSIFLVDQLYNNVDVAGQLRQALPPRFQPLAGPAAGGLRGVAQQGANALLERPRTQKAWEQANRRAHKLLLAVVEDKNNKALSTSGGNVTLDLQALLGQTERLGGLSNKLPAGAAEITILRSNQLAFAQDLVRFMRTLAIALVVLALGLFALAIYLARGWRREALRAAGFGLVLAGAGALVARGIAGGAVVGALATTESVRPAIDHTWTIGTSLLVEAASATIAYGVVTVFAAWLAGPTRLAVSTRAVLAPWLREPGFAYGGLALIVLLVIAWGPTPATRHFLTMLLLIALLIVGMEVLRRQTEREYPNASRQESTRRMRAWFSGLTGRKAFAGSSDDDRIAQLERLGKLRDQGVIDAAEFEREKGRVMSGAPATAG